MKYAKVQASAVYVDCPNCGEGVTDPSTGSYQITADSFAANSPSLSRNYGMCSACGAAFKMPKLARLTTAIE